MQRNRTRQLTSGDLVVIKSPYVHVTLDGYIKSDPAGSQHITGHLIDASGDAESCEIPYETVAVLIDDKKSLIMHEGKILMVPRSCLWRFEDERKNQDR